MRMAGWGAYLLRQNQLFGPGDPEPVLLTQVNDDDLAVTPKQRRAVDPPGTRSFGELATPADAQALLTDWPSGSFGHSVW